MADPISPLSATTPAAGAGAAASRVDVSYLRRSDSGIEQLVKNYPGLAKFLEANAQAICQAKPGDVQTTFDWPVWTHSPRSGGLAKANEQDIIVVWQEVPGSNSTVNFGGQCFSGQIIAVHQVNQRDGRPVQSYPASDQGYLWPNMKVVASGPAGGVCRMQWAVVTLSANGVATSGGFPGGWGGRTHIGKHGSADFIPLKG